MLVRLVPRLLAQLDQLAEVRSLQGEVLVIDNDPSESARSVVESLSDSRLRYVSEQRPGLAAVRNRALEETRERGVLVFLDDDQSPTDGWLVSLADVWDRTGSAAVAGPVTSVLPRGADPWVRDGGFFDRSYRGVLQTGDRILMVATTNLWLDLVLVRSLGLGFDERFGLSGGEDSLFTRSLSRRGAAIVWCADAEVIEEVPPSRLTRVWVGRRAMSNGNTTARVELAMAEAWGQRSRLRAMLAARGLSRAAHHLVAAGAAARAAGSRGHPRRISAGPVPELLTFAAWHPNSFGHRRSRAASNGKHPGNDCGVPTERHDRPRVSAAVSAMVVGRAQFKCLCVLVAR